MNLITNWKFKRISFFTSAPVVGGRVVMKTFSDIKHSWAGRNTIYYKHVSKGELRMGHFT